jgi:hypothetical protein
MVHGKPGFGGFFIQSLNGLQGHMLNLLKILFFHVKGIPLKSFRLFKIQRIQVVLFKKIVEIPPVLS